MFYVYVYSPCWCFSLPTFFRFSVLIVYFQSEEIEEICANFKFSEVKQNLDSNPQYNTYYLILREVRHDVVIERYKTGTQTEISSFFKTVSIVLSM
jgi:hypothetical protein